MTANDLSLQLLDTSLNQTRKVFEGVGEDSGDLRVNAHTMSPRETLAHLCECNEAFFAHLAGKEHSWGSYQPADTGMAALWAAYEARRNEVRAAIAAAGSDAAALGFASDYIIAHEFYHVGQMATFRLTHTPGWDAYAIYG